jgi:tRNA/tmRNA/rRNA uracil-C5-methylase (TrmA/RlmC/RlmD family)
LTEQLTIRHLGHRGDGMAGTAERPVYVPFTLPGEKVTVEAVPGHPDRRRLVSVDKPSHERMQPICKHFGTCGGCALQHWSLAEYHLWKRERVVEALGAVGLVAPVAPLIDAHGQGRRRAVIHARRGEHDVLEVGFAAPRAHHIIAVDACPILSTGLAGAIPAAWAIAEVLSPTRKPLDIQVTATDSGLDEDVRGSGPLSATAIAALARISEGHKLARLTRHGELVAQATQPMLTIGHAHVPLPSGAFLQATTEGEEVLARLVTDHVGNAKRIADLFAGIGPFALRRSECDQSAQPRSRHHERLEAAGSVDTRPVPPAVHGGGAEAFRCRGVRSAAPGRRRPSARTCSQRGAGRGGGLVRRHDFRARRKTASRRRLPTRRRHAGRSIPLFTPRRIGGEVRALSAISENRNRPSDPAT